MSYQTTESIFTFIIYWQLDMVRARNERAGDENKKNLGLEQELERGTTT